MSTIFFNEQGNAFPRQSLMFKCADVHKVCDAF